MNQTDLIFMTLVALLAFNQFVIRTKQWEHRQWLFWFLQLSSVLYGSWVIIWGIPGFNGELSIINWLVGLLFYYHAARNYIRFQAFQRRQKNNPK